MEENKKEQLFSQFLIEFPFPESMEEWTNKTRKRCLRNKPTVVAMQKFLKMDSTIAYQFFTEEKIKLIYEQKFEKMLEPFSEEIAEINLKLGNGTADKEDRNRLKDLMFPKTSLQKDYFKVRDILSYYLKLRSLIKPLPDSAQKNRFMGVSTFKRLIVEMKVSRDFFLEAEEYEIPLVDSVFKESVKSFSFCGEYMLAIIQSNKKFYLCRKDEEEEEFEVDRMGEIKLNSPIVKSWYCNHLQSFFVYSERGRFHIIPKDSNVPLAKFDLAFSSWNAATCKIKYNQKGNIFCISSTVDKLCVLYLVKDSLASITEFKMNIKGKNIEIVDFEFEGKYLWIINSQNQLMKLRYSFVSKYYQVASIHILKPWRMTYSFSQETRLVICRKSRTFFIMLRKDEMQILQISSIQRVLFHHQLNYRSLSYWRQFEIEVGEYKNNCLNLFWKNDKTIFYIHRFDLRQRNLIDFGCLFQDQLALLSSFQQYGSRLYESNKFNEFENITLIKGGHIGIGIPRRSKNVQIIQNEYLY